jgi:glycosyltransferase involved in cell wall biosynthesis
MPGCSDVVRHGSTGFLAPPHAPSLLASRIVDLLGDRAAAGAMGRRAAELVRAEFGLELTVDRYLAVYTELLDQRTKTATAGVSIPFGSRSPLEKRFS